VKSFSGVRMNLAPGMFHTAKIITAYTTICGDSTSDDYHYYNHAVFTKMALMTYYVENDHLAERNGYGC
jgi:hypothetical protein